MSPTIMFTVPGTQVAQPRHRATARSDRIWLYLPAGSPVHSWKSLVRLACPSWQAPAPPFGFCLSVLFAFCPPKSRRIPDGTPRLGKPDLDNLLKAIKDALTGHVWADDAEVTEMYAKKFYSSSPRAVISITAATLSV